jgi:hypothetical protein
MTGQLSTNYTTSSSPSGTSGGNSSPSSTAKHANPTATNGGSGAQTAFNRVCKLQKHGTSLSRRDTDTAQHKRRMSFMRAIRSVFYYS